MAIIPDNPRSDVTYILEVIQKTSETKDKWTKELENQRTNEPKNKWTKEQINQRTSEPENKWTRNLKWLESDHQIPDDTYISEVI